MKKYSQDQPSVNIAQKITDNDAEILKHLLKMVNPQDFINGLKSLTDKSDKSIHNYVNNYNKDEKFIQYQKDMSKLISRLSPEVQQYIRVLKEMNVRHVKDMFN